MRKLSFIFQNLQVKTCTKLEIGKCKSTQVPGALKSKLNHCNFEGRLKEDFQSKFHLMNCDDEMQDIAVISSKVCCSLTSLKWLTVAMPLLETSKRKERETRLE